MWIDIRILDSILVCRYSRCHLGYSLFFPSFFGVLLDIFQCMLFRLSSGSSRSFVVSKLVVSLSFLFQEFLLIPFLLLPSSIVVLSSDGFFSSLEHVSANEILLSSS